MDLHDVWLDEFDDDHLVIGERVVIRTQFEELIPAVVEAGTGSDGPGCVASTGPPESYGGDDPDNRFRGPSV
jgi:hypothetical protein